MPVAAIYISEFPIASLLRDSLSDDLPAAVLEGTPPLERIFSLNPAAGKLGIRHGMSKVQAETSGTVHFHKRSLLEEAAAFSCVQAAAERFSPRIQPVAFPKNQYRNCMQPAASLLLDTSGTYKLFGISQEFAGKLRQQLRAAGFSANIAISPNAEASLLLARSFPGITCLQANDVADRLAHLPVASLQSDPAVLEVFRKWGVHTLAQLAALPEAALISRIGQQGRRMQQMARGVAEHLLIAEEPQLHLHAHVDLDTPVDLLESLLFILSPMLEQLIRQASERACSLRLIVVKLQLEKADLYELVLRPALPSDNRDLLLKLLNLELHSHPPQAMITAVTLTAEPARPQVAQRGLFQSQFPEPGKLDLLLARLRSIAGEGCVGSPVLQNSLRDHEFQIAAYQPGQSSKQTEPPVTSARLALRRMRPPDPVRVMIRNGSPASLYWQGGRLELADAIGPWQSSGYWWEERRWEAEEWDAVIADPPQALRLQHECRHNTWTVVGIYD